MNDNKSNVLVQGVYLNSGLMFVSQPEMILRGFPRKDELQDLKDEQYYPLSLYIELFNHLEATLGRAAMENLGRQIGLTVMDANFKGLNITSVTEAMEAIQAAHLVACKPTMGSFKVVEALPRLVKIEHTVPYNCIMLEGLYCEIVNAYGGKNPVLRHKRCMRNGDPACLYELEW